MVKETKWHLHTRRHTPFEIHAPGFTEAICEHGVGHHKGVHGCDGCCSECPDEIWEKVTDESKDKFKQDSDKVHRPWEEGNK